MVPGTPHAVTGQVQAALPSIAITSAGRIGVLYDTFDGFDGNGFPTFTGHVAQSADQGTTFSDTQLLSFTSPVKDSGDVRQRILGDYQQMKSVGSTLYGVFTGNGSAFGRSLSNLDPIFFRLQAGPVISSVKPKALGQGASKAKVTITGSGFASGANVSVSGSGVTANSVSFVSSQQLVAKISVSSGAAPGNRNVTVTNPDATSDTCSNCLTINPGPVPTSVTPPTGVRGTTLSIVVTGSGFAPGAQVKFKKGVTVNSTTFVDSGHLNASITISSTTSIGSRDVTVINKDKGQGVCSGCFSVTA
jgi:hypothetical protein